MAQDRSIVENSAIKGVAGERGVPDVAAGILLITDSIGFMLFIERFLKADVLAKVGS